MYRPITRLLRVLASASLLAIVGCDSDVQMNEKVEGTVKLDGAPLANVLVEFIPNLKSKEQAPVSRATTDSSGHFVLMCINEKPGAVVGKHNVLIRVGRGGKSGAADDMDAPQDVNRGKGRLIPSEYASASKTPVKVEVTAEQHSYDINVQSVNAAQYRDPQKDKE